MKSKHCSVSQNMHQGLLFCVTEKLMILFKVQHNYLRYFQNLSWVTSMWRQKKKKKRKYSIKMCWNKWKFHPTAGKCLLGHFPDGGWKWVKWDFAGCDASHLMSQIEKCVNTDSRHCKEGEDVSVYLFLSICTFVPYFKAKMCLSFEFYCAFWFMVLCWNYSFKLCQNFTQLSHVPREPYFDLGAK